MHLLSVIHRGASCHLPQRLLASGYWEVRQCLRFFVAVVICASSLVGAAERPNVVLILCDDLRADCISETTKLSSKPEHASTVAQLRAELDRLMKAAGGLPDKLPLDEGIKSGLPEKAIR